MASSGRWLPWAILFTATLLGALAVIRYRQGQNIHLLQASLPAPTHPAPEWIQAVADYEAGRFAQAETALQDHLERYPDHAEGGYLLGLCLLETGKEDLAADWMERVRFNDTSLYAPATWYLGMARIRQGRASEARMLWTELKNGADPVYREKAGALLDHLVLSR